MRQDSYEVLCTYECKRCPTRGYADVIRLPGEGDVMVGRRFQEQRRKRCGHDYHCRLEVVSTRAPE